MFDYHSLGESKIYLNMYSWSFNYLKSKHSENGTRTLYQLSHRALTYLPLLVDWFLSLLEERWSTNPKLVGSNLTPVEVFGLRLLAPTWRNTYPIDITSEGGLLKLIYVHGGSNTHGQRKTLLQSRLLSLKDFI